ncbi:hypothetical protein [Streptomyces sp. NPDC050848]|uniref:hypothetical protein n=1 Tax=Streptomyces sp. NPDC050848 TaxID=3155791 RepID=UPI0033DE31B3
MRPRKDYLDGLDTDRNIVLTNLGNSKSHIDLDLGPLYEQATPPSCTYTADAHIWL